MLLSCSDVEPKQILKPQKVTMEQLLDSDTCITFALKVLCVKEHLSQATRTRRLGMIMDFYIIFVNRIFTKFAFHHPRNMTEVKLHLYQR